MARRGRSEGSVYQLRTGKNAGKWAGSVVVAWHDGRPKRVTRVRKTRKEAQAVLRDLLNQRDRGRLKTHGQDWTLAEWLPHWLDDVLDHQRAGESTRGHYRSKIRTWLVPIIGRVRLDELDVRHWKKVLAAMDAKGSGDSLKHQTWLVLHGAVKAAVDEGLLGHNQLARVKPPGVPKRRIHPPDSDQVTAIYRAALGERMEARWLLALALGLRQGEALGLEWRHVDLDARTLLVEQQLHRRRGVHGCGEPIPAPAEGNPDRKVWACGFRWASKCPAGRPGELVIKATKTDRGNRTAPLTDDMVRLLEALMAGEARERMMLGDAYRTWTTTPLGQRKARPVDLVFRRQDGHAIDPREDYGAWLALLERAGLGPDRLHNARHAAVVGMLDAGLPMADIAELIGHDSVAFTFDTYGSFSREAADRAREKMQAHHARMRVPQPEPAAGLRAVPGAGGV
jgi:integrase